MFYEILTVATFPLVAHKETPEALRAGRKYLVYLLGGAAFVLFSMAATYYLTGIPRLHRRGVRSRKGFSGASAHHLCHLHHRLRHEGGDHAPP